MLLKSCPDVINKYMLNKSDQRNRILEFFENRKLNSNCYFIGYYKRRDALDVYEYLTNYHNYHDILKTASLAQKLYHIKIDSDEIPTEHRFINYVEGYTRGGRRVKNDPRAINDIPHRTINWLKEQLDNHIITSTPVSDLELVQSKIVGCCKTKNYKKMVNDIPIMDSLCFHAKNENIPIMIKLISVFKNTTPYCSQCNNFKSVRDLHLSFKQTCDNIECVHSMLSHNAKSRDNSAMHIPSSRKKAIASRRLNDVWHSEESNKKRSESNKKTWTKEKRAEITKRNRENGLYEMFSIRLKQRILDGSFTPKSTNRLNHKRLISEITGIKSYRSSWELKYHETYPYLKYETIRIPYMLNGVNHAYIVDFVDEEKKIIYEIKPSTLVNSEKVKAKEYGANIWCDLNGYKYKIITENEFDFTN